MRLSHRLLWLVVVSAAMMACQRKTREPDKSPSGEHTRAPGQGKVSTTSDAGLDHEATDAVASLQSPPDWSAASLAARKPKTDGPRFYAKTRHVWIYPEPDLASQWIGFLWTGGSVRLKRTRPVYGPGCSFFYAIEPIGYICSDGNRGTLDPHDPLYQQLLRYSPRTDSPWLHQYGHVRALTRYFAFPNAPRTTPANPDAGADNAFGLDFQAISPSVHEAHIALIDRSTLAYSAAGAQSGKDWLLTSDYALVEREKVTPYPVVAFHGVHLSAQATLPLAFFKGRDRPRYVEAQPGHFEPDGHAYPRLSWVGLTGQRKRVGDDEWLQTKDDVWVRGSDATVPTPAPQTPWGATVNEPDATTTKPKGRATWIEVSIVGGWLIAYEGTTPVFTTLISPGSGGLPKNGQAPIDTFSTPLGRFQINGKFISSTMTGPTGLIHSEVPYAQNFADLYAIHTAYWHDNWGNPMSGGCINVAPIDGYFLFHWTEPTFFDDWYGMRWLPARNPSTIVIIHR